VRIEQGKQSKDKTKNYREHEESAGREREAKERQARAEETNKNLILNICFQPKQKTKI
jgi:hypothetical protein